MRLLLALPAAGLIAVALLWTPAPVPGAAGDQARTASPATAAVNGDVNCSGVVDSVDALQVLRDAAGMTTSAQCLEAAGDVDCDSDRDAVDALKILRYTAGLPAGTPGCTPIGEPLASSDELIDQALADGKITDEEATIYQVYTAFGDSRLPEEYRGAPSDLPDSDAAMIAAVKFDGLSQEGQDALRPFLTPPYAPGSWLQQPVAGAAEPVAGVYTWVTFPAVEGKVKVSVPTLYPGWFSKAEAVADAVTETIWPSLIALMGDEHAPLSDAGYPDDGGDGALDIYLVPISEEGTLGVTIPYINIPEGAEGPCERSPAYIQIKGQPPLGDATTPGILSTVAHEILHAFQAGFDFYTDCWWPDYFWFFEASSTWVEDYVYPMANAEHPMASKLLNDPGLPLDDLTEDHAYGAYLFPFYFTHKLNAPGLVRSVWESFSSQRSLAGIESVLAPYGGFEALWPEFVEYNWNDPPIEQYDDWDGLTKGATFGGGGQLRLDGAASKKYDVSAKVDYLAAAYRYFSFALSDINDEPLRSVTFNNTLVGYPHANVQGLWYAGGDWHGPEDWTDEPVKFFCRDDESTRVDTIVIIISNSDWESQQELKPETTPTIEVSETPCSRWIGEATMAYHEDDGFTVEDRTAVAHDLVFEAAPDQGGAATSIKFLLKKGTLEWTASSTLTCTVTDSHTFDATDHGGGDLTVTASDGHLSYSGYVYSYVAGSGECQQEHGRYIYGFSGDEMWFRTGPVPQVSDDLSHLVGESSYSGGGATPFTYHYTWDLRAAPPESSPSPAAGARP